MIKDATNIRIFFKPLPSRNRKFYTSNVCFYRYFQSQIEAVEFLI